MAGNAVYRYVKVALDVPLRRVFDYKVIQVSLADIGRRVMVTFANRRQLGVIVAVANVTDIPENKIKSVDEVLMDIPALSSDLLLLFRFCSEYYHYPLGQVIFTALPTRLRKIQVFQPKTVRYLQAVKDFREILPARATVQRQLANALLMPVSDSQLKRLSAQAGQYLERWLTEGFIKEIEPAHLSQIMASAASPVLNTEQKAAVQSITHAKSFQPFLLYGVTGSGKTEVYLEAIGRQLAQCLQTLLLVPEINLTPQLEILFKARFPAARIVSLHSNVGDTQRARIWLQAEQGEVDIVLGTRLAVFTPLPYLGLVIIDEEHDSSFKQQEGLRYHARDVAVFRAKKANIPVILGSATPALESWHNAKRARYHLLTLSQRAVEKAQLPEVRILSTDRIFLLEGLHPESIKAIDKALARHEQVLVFLNRRGYAPVLHCHQCGWIAHCKRCSSHLVVHLREDRLKCHLCGHEEPLPCSCPTCGDTDMQPVGQGTQRLELALKKHFPHAEVIRVDRDSMRHKASWIETFDHVKDGQGQILLGTQMLAKGHDFPNLGLAVILNTDAGLYSADFRAEERLFAQLMQVAGRVGRAQIPGRVLLQTQYAGHPLYLALQQYDYAPFANHLLQDRKISHFPPYCFQAILRAEAQDINKVLCFLYEAKSLAPLSEVILYDPIPALRQKLAGNERAQLLLQDTSRLRLQQFIDAWVEILCSRKQSKIRWALDIDPIEI